MSSLFCCWCCCYVHCIPTSADRRLFWWRRKYFDLKFSLISGEMKMLIFCFFCCVDVYLCWMSESFSSWLLSKSTYHCPLLPCNAPLLLSLTHKLSILRYSYRDSDAVIAMPSRRCRLHSSFSFHNFWTPWFVQSISQHSAGIIVICHTTEINMTLFDKTLFYQRIKCDANFNSTFPGCHDFLYNIEEVWESTDT